MQWFDNLSIKMKMLVVAAVMLLLVLGLSLFSAFQMRVISSASTEIADNWLPSARLVSSMQRDIDDLYIAKLRNEITVTLGNPQALKDGLAQIRFLENEKNYAPLIASEYERALYNEYSKWRAQYLRLISANLNAVSNQSEHNAALFDAYLQVTGALDELLNVNIAGANMANRRADEVYAQSRRWLVGAVVISLALAILLIAIMHYRIARPIRRLAKTANMIGQGELAARSKIIYARDELGELARNFDHMAETLQQRQQEVEQSGRLLTHKFDQLQAIHRLTEMINQIGPVENVYQAALDTLHETVLVDRASILLYDEQGVMRYVASRGLSEFYCKQTEGHSPWTADTLDAQPVLVFDIEQESSLTGLQETLVAEGIRALAFIPLTYHKKLLGKVILYCNKTHDFSAEEVQLTETIATQIAFAVERTRQTNQLKYQALYDNLTNIPNRSLLQDRLQQAIVASQRTNVPLTFLLIDLDRFKEINDTLGHDQGDLLLKQIGPRIQSVLRQFDTVARLGGDEFAVVLPTVSTAEHAEMTAGKILRALQAPFIVGTFSMEVGASIGIALYPDHGGESDALLRCADVAMYVAKRQHSGYAMYTQQLDQHSLRKLTLISELRNAIEHNQLVLHYQPTLCLKTQDFLGVEALVRWLHPQHGLIYPDQFIPEAEQSELEKPLRQWVISQALQQHGEWKCQGHIVPVAVNLSARSLHDVTLPQQLEKLLRQHQVNAGMLTLEITESAIMIDPARALTVLTQISQMGIQITIDDFGTGYSSLAYLQKLPANAVKIDQSFVMEMNKDANQNMIVRSTIELAHNLDISVTAEGVESEQVWLALALLGCDAGQGHYICCALPAGEFIQWLQLAKHKRELYETVA